MKVAMYFDFQPNGILFHFPSEPYRSELNRLLVDCKSRYGGYCTIDVTRPYKSRSNQQNRMFWGIVQQIAFETGNDLEDVEEAVKERAAKRGYPMKVNNLTGKPKPESMTKVNTVEMGYLLEEAMQLASELGIVVEKELQKPDIF